MIHYRPIAARELIPIQDEAFLASIAEAAQDKPLDLPRLRDLAFSLTTRQLAFTFAPASAHPDTVLATGRANCVGYAALFNATAHELIRQRGMESKLEVIHLVGKLYLFGVDLHQLFRTPFFADHDYILLRDTRTGETTATDPSIGDYLWIREVRSE